METKKIRVSGLATVRVSVVIEVDLDEDGIVSVFDLALLKANLGK